MTTPMQAPPGIGFVAGIRLATGVHRTDAFAVAQLLAYHVPPRLAHESTERIVEGMTAFAGALRLGPPTAHPPYCGNRIRIRRGLPWLDYGDDEYRLCLPADQTWLQLVAAGGPVRICVLFEPHESGFGQTAMAEHVRGCFARGTMRWGTVYHV